MTWNKKYIDILGKQIAYVEMGQGDPIIFQHGNPTSSFLWRNILSMFLSNEFCLNISTCNLSYNIKSNLFSSRPF